MQTFNQAESKIRGLGGYSKIESMPLEQRNAYGAVELSYSQGLNKLFLYNRATKKGICLYKELADYDLSRTEGKPWYEFTENLLTRLIQGGDE